MNISFTKAEIRQLISYCGDRDNEKWYYGKKDDFEKRHTSILAKLRVASGDDVTDSSTHE